jgi:hypothetical protein
VWVALFGSVAILCATPAWWALGGGMYPCCKLTQLMRSHCGVSCCCSAPDLSKVAQALAEVKAALAPYQRAMAPPAQVGAGVLVAHINAHRSTWLPQV